MEAFIPLALIAFFAIALVSKAIVIVKQSEAIVVERLGSYDRTLSSGLNIILPIVEIGRAHV